MHKKENELCSAGSQSILPDQDFKERPPVTVQAVIEGDERVAICQQIGWIWSIPDANRVRALTAVCSLSSTTLKTSAPPSSLVLAFLSH